MSYLSNGILTKHENCVIAVPEINTNGSIINSEIFDAVKYCVYRCDSDFVNTQRTVAFI